VVVPPVKEVFHSSEKRLGCKKGLVAQIQVGDKSIALGAIHIDLSSTAKDRAEQLKAVLTAIPKADIQLIGGDWNCGTFNLRRKWEIITQSVGKLITIGFTKAIHHYMTPELKYDKPLFDVLLANGFVFDSFNDRTKGTIHLNIDDVLTNSKAKRFIPTIFLKELSRRLRPWNGAMPLKIDWLAGKGGLAVNAQTIVNPQINTTLLSDHNPIYVDLELT
jgi:endonuclease/exonuclease/phosphatase family metal-dependent hydrolase